MALTPFEHPVLSAWTGDVATRAAFSWDAEGEGLRAFWIALAEASAEAGAIPARAGADLASALRAATLPEPASLSAAAARDGVVVPGLVAALRDRLPATSAEHLHRGATSQDAVDTGAMLRMRDLCRWQAGRLDAVADGLNGWSDRFGGRPLMAVTRLRDALPITVADRVARWRRGAVEAGAALRDAAGGCAVQLCGPVGDLRGFDGRGDAVRAALARRLDLRDPGACWHVDRAPVLAVGAALERTARSCGKVGLDLGAMAADPIGAAVIRGGASSAMAHKSNPVDAELAVAAARMAAALSGMLAGAALHEGERSGTGWAQEWMVLPQLAGAAGAGLVAVERLLRSVEGLGRQDGRS